MREKRVGELDVTELGKRVGRVDMVSVHMKINKNCT